MYTVHLQFKLKWKQELYYNVFHCVSSLWRCSGYPEEENMVYDSRFGSIASCRCDGGGTWGQSRLPPYPQAADGWRYDVTDESLLRYIQCFQSEAPISISVSNRAQRYLLLMYARKIQIRSINVMSTFLNLDISISTSHG